MGSILSKIYEDIEDYEWLCDKLNVPSKDPKYMYDHARKIIKDMSNEDKKKLEGSYIISKFK